MKAITKKSITNSLKGVCIIRNAKKNSKIRKTGLEKNDLYCLQFGGYLLNNWTELASLWSNMHLRDLIKHGKEKPYLEWSKTSSEKA